MAEEKLKAINLQGMNHPVLTNRVRFSVWWLVWLFLAMGQSLLFYYAYGSFTNISIIDSILSLLIYSLAERKIRKELEYGILSGFSIQVRHRQQYLFQTLFLRERYL